MRRFIDWEVKNPWKVILILLALTVFFGYQIKNLKMNPDITAALPQSIPAKRLYDKMKKIFPSKTIAMVIYQGNVFSPEGASELMELTSSLEDFPEVYSVMSATNAKVILGTPEGIEVKEALEEKPTSPQDIQRWKTILASNPKFRKLLIANDEKSSMLLIFLQKSANEDAFAEKLLAFVKKFNASHRGKIFATGEPVINLYISKGIAKDMGIFFTSGIILIFLLLLVIFTSARGVLIPLTVVLSSVIWTLGFMALVKRPMSHSTEMLPILIMAIGIADSIHILSHYYFKAPSYSSAKELVRDIMYDLWAPVVMTSLTTMAGFLALNTSHMESLEELGVFSAFGVFIALIWSLSFVPSVLSLLKLKTIKKRTGLRNRVRGWMEAYAEILVKKKMAFAIAISLIILLSVFAASKLRVEASTISQFPKDNPVRKAAEFVNQHFAGTTTFYLFVEGNRDGYLKKPRVLRAMDELQSMLEKDPHVGATQSIADFVKLLNKAFHNNDPAYYRIPAEVETEVAEDGKKFTVEGEKIVAQLLQLYEMSASPEDFANLVDFNYRNGRVAIFVNTDKNSVLTKIDRKISDFLKRHGELRADLTGMAKLILVVRHMVITGQFWSIIASLILVWFLTALMFRSAIIGIFNTLPLFFGIFLNFATMGALGIPLDIQTMVTSSLAIGIGVDYAIHFIHRYIREVKEGNFTGAVRPSMRTSGVAILFNSFVVASGFMLLVLSVFKGVRAMGFLLALTMITTAFASLTILPIYFITFKPKSLIKASRRVK